MESNCGVAIISPMYWGRVRPQCYQLTYRGNYAGTYGTEDPPNEPLGQA